jgi:hypothetical protein
MYFIFIALNSFLYNYNLIEFKFPQADPSLCIKPKPVHHFQTYINVLVIEFESSS